MTTLASKQLEWFKLDPKQPRKQFNEEELRQLAESMKVHGQLQPVLAKPDGTLIAGERRLRAAPMAGMTELRTILTDRPLSDTEIRLIQLTENLQRADLTDAELYRACKELMAINPGWTKKDLAAHLHKDASMVTRILAVDDLIPAAKEAFLGGAFRFSKVYEVSKASAQEQHELLAAILCGTPRDEIKRQVRKSRKASAPAVRLSRVKIAMPQGASVVVSGQELSMAEVVELLTETLKEARKAAEQYDVKTFQSMMRDRAKAG
jgi:ParB family chromosome partitioning protein